MRKKKPLSLALLTLLLLIVLALCLGAGTVFVAPADVLLVLLGRARDPAQQAVILTIRAPRVFSGALAGAGLAIAGALMQGVFRNPLAEPGLLGVSSGAGMGALCSMALGMRAFLSLPAMAFLGAMLAVAAIVLAASGGRGGTVTLIMSGMAVSALCGAATSVLLTLLREYQVAAYVFWTLGSLANRRWEHVLLLLPVVGACAAVSLCLAPRLDVLMLGDEQAKALGVRPVGTRLLMIFVASACTAAIVSVTGPIGFVGLIVPHCARMLFGASHRLLVAASCLMGAIFLPLCDLGVRLLGAGNGTELSVGVVTAALGAPFFLYLLRRKGGYHG